MAEGGVEAEEVEGFKVQKLKDEKVSALERTFQFVVSQ